MSLYMSFLPENILISFMQKTLRARTAVNLWR